MISRVKIGFKVIGPKKTYIEIFLCINIYNLCTFNNRSDPNIVKSNIEVLVSVGLGERAQKDFLLAQDTCIALLKLAGEGKVCIARYINE